ncbi:MAG: DUF3987 domain-containing protein [Rhodoplanes sp.]
MDAETQFAPLRDDEINIDANRRDQNPWDPVVPMPDGAPPLTKAMIEKFCPAGYAFTSGWYYRDPDGHRLLYMARYDRPANGQQATKQFRPLTYCHGPDGRAEWRCKNLPLPRPIFGLDELAVRPDTPVLIVEGEKTVIEASNLFIDHVVITSPNGSNSARKADWSPLAGRAVTIWPDNDPPGSGYAADVADMLHKAGAASVRVVQIPVGWPPCWDLADPLPPGVTEADLAELLAEAASVSNVESDVWPTPQPIASTLPPVEAFEAQNLYREWMQLIQVEARSGAVTSTLESHILKMPKTVASLALIFELIDGGLQFVGEEATRLALGWADYLRSHANRLYAAGQTMTEEGARLIVERRGQLPDPFTIRDIQRKGWATLADHEAVLAAVDVLIATSHCREVRSTASPAGGRPSVRYVWNPTLRQKE